MPGRLQDRVTIITGSSSGIGRATAFAFAAEGARIVCADLTENSWRENQTHNDEHQVSTHARLQQDGHQAIFVKTDVTDPASVEALVAAAVAKYGRLDVMINNAGMALESRAPSAIWDMPLDALDKTLAVNVKGVFYGVKYASAQMIKQDPLPNGDRGWILNACSVFGLVGAPYASAYCTSKGAVSNLTRAAALDCAPYRIHVNSVNPGYVKSYMTDPLLESEEQASTIGQLHPFGGGPGRPEDIAKAYVFLASDDAAWISGISLPVDGAYTAR